MRFRRTKRRNLFGTRTHRWMQRYHCVRTTETSSAPAHWSRGIINGGINPAWRYYANAGECDSLVPCLRIYRPYDVAASSQLFAFGPDFWFRNLRPCALKLSLSIFIFRSSVSFAHLIFNPCFCRINKTLRQLVTHRKIVGYSCATFARSRDEVSDLAIDDCKFGRSVRKRTKLNCCGRVINGTFALAKNSRW